LNNSADGWFSEFAAGAIISGAIGTGSLEIVSKPKRLEPAARLKPLEFFAG
jgi:hypothetical protein